MTTIVKADFADANLITFLEDHLADLAPTAPAESRHALDISQLDNPNVRLWVCKDGDEIIGTIALAQLTAEHEELKSMRTSPSARGKGIATLLLDHAVSDAKSRGIKQISLETGTMEFFKPARNFYKKHGFETCPPFGTYVEDANSTFMTLLFG